jgi:TFIIF-interacting CTD phosphatase-like protein
MYSSLKASTPLEKIIFIDLDETLIHTLSLEYLYDPNYKNELPTVTINFPGDKYDYKASRRPNALKFLKALRKIGPVYMLTRAVHEYAVAMNQAFKFGFTENQIFDRAYVNGKKKVILPHVRETSKAILIDDRNSSDNHQKFAFCYQHCSSVKYIRVAEFLGFRRQKFTQDYIDSTIKFIVNA